jgi:hypothetical protein
MTGDLSGKACLVIGTGKAAASSEHDSKRTTGLWREAGLHATTCLTSQWAEGGVRPRPPMARATYEHVPGVMAVQGSLMPNGASAAASICGGHANKEEETYHMAGSYFM